MAPLNETKKTNNVQTIGNVNGKLNRRFHKKSSFLLLESQTISISQIVRQKEYNKQNFC